MLNRIILMGRLTKDPELRQTKNDIPVSGFSLAVERNYAKKGETREVDFFDIVAWKGQAEFISKYFTKGQLVCVDGRLQRRSWTDNDNKTRYAYEVIAQSIHFAGFNKNNGQSNEQEFDPFEDGLVA